MSRTSLAFVSASDPSDLDAINLRRALTRLEHQILVPGPDSRLLYSSYDRKKTSQNLEYARTLLLGLERAAPTIKTQARKHERQAELARHRTTVKRLSERLYELDRRDDDLAGDEGGEHEDLLSEYFAPEPAPVKSTTTASTVPGLAPTTTAAMATATATASPEGVRARGTPAPSAAPTATPTRGPSSALTAELFAGGARGGTTTGGKAGAQPEELSAEKRLEQQDSTQAELTSSLVALAQQLKASSLAFAEDLALDADAVARTEGALGKNKEGLDAASQRMGVLRRMSEGRWWWQRYIMYIVIVALWILQFALVFLGPKIRL